MDLKKSLVTLGTGFVTGLRWNEKRGERVRIGASLEMLLLKNARLRSYASPVCMKLSSFVWLQEGSTQQKNAERVLSQCPLNLKPQRR